MTNRAPSPLLPCAAPTNYAAIPPAAKDPPNKYLAPFQLWKSQSYLCSLCSLVLLLVIFTTLEILVLKYNLPAVDPADREAIKIPRDLDDLQRLNHVLNQYMDQHFFKVYVTFVVSFIYLQSFSIPGSMWLSVLGGALFPFWLTLITVCICSSIGASLAFLLSGSLGSKAIMHLFGARISKWNEQLVQHKQHMFNYMIVLRIAPLPPNWVVNLGAPHLGIPLFTFFWGTFLGVAPLSFIQIQAGAALDRLSSSDKLVIFTPLNIACLFGIAIAALIPVFVKRRYNM